MIVNCPRCQKKYYLPVSVVDRPIYQNNPRFPSQYGWWLSCSHCDHHWWQISKNTPSSPLPITPPSSFNTGGLSAVRSIKKRSWALTTVSLLIVSISIGGVGYLYYKPLQIWFYSLIGTPVSSAIQPLFLQDVHYTLIPDEEDEKTQMLMVRGSLINPNSLPLETPTLKIMAWAECQSDSQEMANSEGEYLYLEWIFKPNAGQIGPLNILPFETSNQISAQIKRVEVTFH